MELQALFIGDPVVGLVLDGIPWAVAEEPGGEAITEFSPVLERFAWFAATVLAVLIASRLLLEPGISRVIRQRNRNNPTLEDALLRYFRLGVMALAVLAGTVVAGYGNIIADSALVVSAVALAIGVAAQETIGSLVSGLVLVKDPEFNVGDHIEWEGYSGIVATVALRVTRVKTPTGELVTVPNTVLTDNEITRPYGTGYRVSHDIAVGGEKDLEAAMAGLTTAADSIAGILAHPPPTVYIDEFSADGAIITVQYWVDTPDPGALAEIRSAFSIAAKRQLE